LTLSDSRVTGNSTGVGAAAGTGSPSGLAGWGGPGGGLGAGSGSITRTEISGNTTGLGGNSSGTPGAGGTGGGLFSIYASVPLNISDSAITGNATGAGGAPHGPGGDGGGLYAEQTKLNVSNSTISGNATGAAGIGAGVGGGGSGGGIFSKDAGSVIGLAHLTVAGNQVASDGTGGGIVVGGAGVTLANSIVASNSSPNCIATAGSIADGGHNIRFPDAACPGTSGDPLLAALAGNGGFTKTMALGEGSAAIDVVPTTGAGCPAADQRGTGRPQRSACDAGAFELGPKPPDPPPAEQPPPAGDTPTPPPTGGTTVVVDKTAPLVKLLLRAQRLLKVLKNGYAVDFSTNEPGSAVAELFAEGPDVKGAAVKRKRVARGARTFTTAGKKRVVAKFTKRAKKAFAKRKRLRLLLVLTVKDKAGNVKKVSRRVRFKR
jgi:hypothetical protein